MNKQASHKFHKNRVRRLLDVVALRVILNRGTTRAASVAEIVEAMTPAECARLVRSAYALAEEDDHDQRS